MASKKTKRKANYSRKKLLEAASQLIELPITEYEQQFILSMVEAADKDEPISLKQMHYFEKVAIKHKVKGGRLYFVVENPAATLGWSLTVQTRVHINKHWNEETRKWHPHIELADRIETKAMGVLRDDSEYKSYFLTIPQAKMIRDIANDYHIDDPFDGCDLQ